MKPEGLFDRNLLARSACAPSAFKGRNSTRFSVRFLSLAVQQLSSYALNIAHRRSIYAQRNFQC